MIFIVYWLGNNWKDVIPKKQDVERKIYSWQRSFFCHYKLEECRDLTAEIAE